MISRATPRTSSHFFRSSLTLTLFFSSPQPFLAEVCAHKDTPRTGPFDAVCGTRERPFLLFDAKMRPTHLVNGINSVCQGGNKDGVGKDWTYTFIQEINVRNYTPIH
jgi:hypothetical protein